jgi:beta-glucanase (GH16 family)
LYKKANIAGGINGTSELHDKFFVLLNFAVGGDWPGSPDDGSVFPQKMYVDYIRYYKYD